MDRERFDALARVLATTGSRRAALAVLLAGGLLGHDPAALAKPGTGRKRRKHRKHRRQDHDGGQTPAEPTGVCCDDTRPCAPPGPGSVRSGCDFAEQAFAGQDHQGAIFRQIDGVGAAFDNTDNRGSIFAAACLRFATFRGAKLAGAIWRDACLFAADFTGAELDVEAAAFGGAVLCATIMPDGTRNDRDCGRSEAFACCLPPPGGGGAGGGPCTGPQDCPDVPCRTKACIDGGCVYTPVADGPSPNGLCDTHCCGIFCCPSAKYVCHQGRCCLPRGPFDCGRGPCSAICKDCPFCFTLAGGETQCASSIQFGCGLRCSSDADCPAVAPTCIASITRQSDNVTTTMAEFCETEGTVNVCANPSLCGNPG